LKSDEYGFDKSDKWQNTLICYYEWGITIKKGYQLDLVAFLLKIRIFKVERQFSEQLQALEQRLQFYLLLHHL